MRGNPVTTEPAVLVVDEEVRNILEEVGFLTFFNNFKGHSEGITKQFVDTWKDGRVIIDKIKILVSAGLIVKVFELPNEGEVISRKKMNQVSQLTKFIKEKEIFCWLDSGITRELFPKPWDNIAMVLMKYLTLEGKFRKLFGHNIAFLNFVRNKEKGLMKMLVDFFSSKNSPTAEEDGDSESQKKESPVKNPNFKGGRKRKTPAQVLSSNLAKCSRRSSQLQRKSVGKPALLHVADTLEEERNLEEPLPSGVDLTDGPFEIMVGSWGIPPSPRKDCVVMKMEDNVKELLDKAGLLDFFKNFFDFSKSLSLQVAKRWDEGRVKVDGLVFTILEQLIAEASGLPIDGEVICRGKTNQVEKLSKFIRNNETFCWLQSGIARESLPAPWDRVVVQVMKYLTLEGKFRKLFGCHIAILNSIRNRVKINVPLLLLKSLEKSIKTVKSGKGKLPLHQGLLKMLVNYEKARITSAPLILKGNLIRTSGTLVSKAQLLLSLASLVPKTSVDSFDLEEEGDNPSEDTGVSIRKKEPMEKIKDSAKIPPNNQNVLKELKSHLKVLNSLGGSLTGTYAYINLLTLEITNYLKEVVSRLKELNSGRF
eukprot:Gb_10421 [translate_table: standard]